MEHREHVPTLRAVARGETVPNASDMALCRAKKAGLIAFKHWPAGHWFLTHKGRTVLEEANHDTYD